MMPVGVKKNLKVIRIFLYSKFSRSMWPVFLVSGNST